MVREVYSTHVNSPERTHVDGRSKTAVSPRFDDGSIRRARPAVPLQKTSPLNPWPRMIVLLALFAGLVGGVAGVVGTSLYQRRESARRAPETARQMTPPREEASARAAESATPGVGEPTYNASSTGNATSTDNTTVGETEAARVAAHASEGEATAARAAEAGRGGEAGEHAALRASLGEWIAATNARDLSRQMSFYDSKLESFYLARGARASAVRAEKERVFGRAGRIAVEADAPDIRLGPDGRTATMRFRKRYRITGGGEDRRGEVVQELRWRKTEKGWRIVSERDLRVLN